jgi:hypothetical protein
MPDLYALFSALPAPSPDESGVRRFMAAAPWGHVSIRLAKSSDSRPYFLLPDSDDHRAIGVRLEHLSVEPATQCTIIEQDGRYTIGRYILIGCTSSDAELQAFFLRVISASVGSLGANPAQASISHSVELLVELFKGLRQPAKKSIRGLWAELFVIAESSSPIEMLDAWHGAPQELYDFSRGPDRLEVKSSTDKREHHFRREQLIPPEGCQLTVASVIVKSAGGGASVADLVELIGAMDGMDASRIEKVCRIAAETLGEDWRLGITLRFDLQWARQSVQFYEGSDIPGIRGFIPPEITEIHFIVDMSRSIPLADDALGAPESLRRVAIGASKRH